MIKAYASSFFLVLPYVADLYILHQAISQPINRIFAIQLVAEYVATLMIYTCINQSVSYCRLLAVKIVMRLSHITISF